MNEDYIAKLRSEISFLQDCSIEPETRGNSRTPCFILTKNGAKYFLKLHSKDSVTRLKNIQSTYNKAKVNTAKIIKIGYLENLNQTYCIYEFIDGSVCDQLLEISSLTELETIGRKIGQELAKFNAVQGDTKKFQQDFDQELTRMLDLTATKKLEYNRTHTDQMPEIDLDLLRCRMQDLKSTIYLAPPIFTHSDINLRNIIMHRDQPYFIDIGGSRIKFRTFNFRGICWWAWHEHTEREQAIYRGIFQALFNHQIPSSFHDELNFAVAYAFLRRNERYEDDLEQIRYSFEHWRNIFARTNYFTDYRYDWF